LEERLGLSGVSPALRPRLLWSGLAALGLALYLWPAFAAPVVLWADSEIDIQWAKAGVGVLSPVPPPPAGGALGHLPKPAYLLFLRAAMRAVPGVGEERSIVIVQSFLLGISIVASSYWIARRRGGRDALLFLAIALAFLRLRDASSAVMTEALAAALLLPIVSVLLAPPRRLLLYPLVGLATAALWLVRPNCGGAALLLGVLGLSLFRMFRPAILFGAGFGALMIAFIAVARPIPASDPLYGLGYQVLEAASEYYWTPSVEPWPVADSPREMARAELQRAVTSWRKTLSQPGPDKRREVVWRALHGLFGQEYYDARWSPSYARASEFSRLASPLFLLAAIVAVLAVPWRGSARIPKAMGILTLALLIGQNLLLGSNPRYVLPFLPALFLFGVCTLTGFGETSRSRRIAPLAALPIFTLLLASQRHVLDWQAGKVESSGVVLRQRIPRGAFPGKSPATLHLRIAPPLPSSGAHFTLSVEHRLLFSSQSDPDRRRAAVTVALPQWLLDENARGPIALEVVSTGDYGDYSYLLFPVIPLPWSQPARRDGSVFLSPTTGIRAGSFDWWAHAGSP